MTRSERAWKSFCAHVSGLGGVVLEPTWLGSQKPHRVRCALGHECAPRPADVRRGRGLCRVCGGNDPATAEAAFRERVAKLGGVVLEPAWLGSGRPHRVKCASGHDCTPRPDSIQKGGGLCRTCAGQEPAVSEAMFHARIAELEGVVLEPMWLGARIPHRVRCAKGHDCAPRPTNAQRGKGICQVCAGNDSVAAEAAFHAQVVALGGTVLEPIWLGNDAPHRVRCPVGHDCAPRPTGIQQGQGLCRICAGKIWDVFYIVASDSQFRLKFGITSGNPRPRLRRHQRDGYQRVILALIDLPGTVAPDMERDVIATLRLAGEQPMQGREYYGIHVLATVLDIVNNYPR